MIQAYSKKHPDSEEFFSFDFTPDLEDGDSLSVLVGVTITEGDDLADEENLTISIAAPAGMHSPIVTWFGTLGRLGKRYTVTAEATTANGERLVKSGTVYISKQL